MPLVRQGHQPMGCHGSRKHCRGSRAKEQQQDAIGEHPEAMSADEDIRMALSPGMRPECPNRA
jgi:hypothetical protein